MKTWKLKAHLISGEIFNYSLITYLILLLAETLQEGFVSFFFDLNLLLIVVLISGVVMVLTHSEVLEQHKEKKKMTSADVQNAILFAVLGSLLVYVKTQPLGNIAIAIAVLTGIIILLLSLLIFSEDTK